MTGTVTVDWALWSKPQDSPLDYHIVRASGGEEDRPLFTRLILPLLPGSPDYVDGAGKGESGLPWVTFGAEQDLHGAASVTICVTSKAAERDHSGRRLSRSLLYRFPSAAVAERRVGFTALWESVKSVPLPEGPEPLHLKLAPQPWDEIAAGIERDGRFDWYAATAAALLERPVAITAGTSLGPDRAVAVLDSIACLIPYGFRSALTAATCVDGMTDHRLRLVFAPHAERGAAEIPFRPDSGPPATVELGELGVRFLRELHGLARERHGSVRAVARIMAAYTDHHDFGPAATQSRWALTVLRQRDPAASVLRDLADEHGGLRRTPGGNLEPAMAAAEFRDEVERVLRGSAPHAEARWVLYEYLARGPLPEQLPEDQWPAALEVIASVAGEALAVPVAVRDRALAEDDPWRFGTRTAECFLSACPDDLCDNLVSLLLRPPAPLRRPPLAYDREALLTNIAERAAGWIDSRLPPDPAPPPASDSPTGGAGPYPLTRASLAAQPELVYRILENTFGDRRHALRILDLVDVPASPDPGLRLMVRLLFPSPGEDGPVVPDSVDDIAEADAARPGWAEILLCAAQALGRADTVLSSVWPILLSAATRAGPRALATRRIIGAARAMFEPGPAGEDYEGWLDCLLLLADEDEPGNLSLGERLGASGLDAAYVESLTAAWHDRSSEPWLGRLAALAIKHCIKARNMSSTGTSPGPDPTLTAVSQLLDILDGDLPPQVVDVLIRARDADSLELDLLPEEFWIRLGDRYPSLADRHWATLLRAAGDEGPKTPIVDLWPKAVAAGLTPRDLLSALGPWPRTSALQRALQRLRMYLAGRVNRTRTARIEELIDMVRLPSSFSSHDAERHREELRTALASGVWGKQEARTFRMAGRHRTVAH